MTISADEFIDIHVHVGLMGDRWPKLGKLSEWYRQQINYKIFLLYARLEPDKVCDTALREVTVKLLTTTGLKRVVCLALDPVYDIKGNRREDASHMWVDNNYVLSLQEEVGPKADPKVLLGASVHPYDPDFQNRVRKYVGKGACLIKWVPSSQQINLADERVKEALVFLARARNDGRALPLLLHVGPEYAIPTTDPKALGYDCLSWSTWDRIANRFRGSNGWYTPNVKVIEENIRAGLEAGATIIFAHCGLPYFTSGLLAKLMEHSEFDTVAAYLQRNLGSSYTGRCFTDTSALCTPFRKPYFPNVRMLPPEYIVFGSDFPTPVFELSAGPEEIASDFKAVLEGHIERVLIPQDNLLDVNFREMRNAFPGHPMFKNLAKLLQ